jgi:hypothetical protein
VAARYVSIIAAERIAKTVEAAVYVTIIREGQGAKTAVTGNRYQVTTSE